MAPYEPLCRRIRRETQAKIAAGILKPGDKLPTTKEPAVGRLRSHRNRHRSW